LEVTVAFDASTYIKGEFHAGRNVREFSKAGDVKLRDAGEEGPEIPIPALKPFQRDLTNGLAKGYMWGYQHPNGKRRGKRMDKILYTGGLVIVPIESGEEVARGIARLGVGLRTEVQATKSESEEEFISKSGRVTVKLSVECYSIRRMEAMKCAQLERQKLYGGTVYDLTEDMVLTTTLSWRKSGCCEYYCELVQ
jgi:hypothetical protein